MRLPVFKSIVEWWINPPAWFTSATNFIAASISPSPAKSEVRLYRISKIVVAALLILYSALVAACLTRVLYAIFSESPDDINKLLLALGGVIGGPFLIWRTLIAYQQIAISREGQFTTLFTKAVEQLGATREVQRVQVMYIPGTNTPPTITETEPNFEVRLGAIYALERITHDSERDHWPIMEVLSAYVRNRQNSGEPKTEEDIKSIGLWPASIPAPRPDVQAAITVMGRRPIARIEFEKGRGHYLDFANANLQSAIFFKQCFPSAEFSGASLQNTQWQRSDAQGSRFTYAKLASANFALSKLEGAAFDFADANKAIFICASGEKCSFARAKLVNVDFTEACLNNAYFGEAELSKACFKKASLVQTDFRKADLTGASFIGAKFEFDEKAELLLRSPAFKGATLFDADFSEASGLTKSVLEDSIGDHSIKLPKDVERPHSWASKYLDDMERIDARYGKPD